MAIYSKYARVVPPSARKPLIVLLVSLLLLRSRILAAPGKALRKLKVVTRTQRLTPDELNRVLQQLYVKEADGSKTLLVPYRDTYLSKVCTILSGLVFFRTQRSVMMSIRELVTLR
jgi:ATP-binding cassette, subfamily D (ALD), peroxisomal long-chain fatty acid import protein